MNRERSFVGTMSSMSWLSRFRNRALVFGLPIAAFAVLSVYPERYEASATLTPADPSSMGLGGTLGQLGATSSVFGNQAAVEVALRVANSVYVRDIAIQNGHLDKLLGASSIDLHRKLEGKVDIRSLRGAIILIDVKDTNPERAKAIVTAYTDALRQRLGEIARMQTAYKRDILEKLVSDAGKNYADAQDNYNSFRLKNRDPAPSGQLDLVNQRIVMLQSAIEAKNIALKTARQLYTDNNIQIRQIKAEIDALQNQLGQARTLDPNSAQSNVGSVVANSRKLFALERTLNLQRSLYDSYQRFLEGTAVENLASTANVRVLEPPYVETTRQYWLPALMAAIALALLWGAIEFYRMRPPVGAPIKREDDNV